MGSLPQPDFVDLSFFILLYENAFTEHQVALENKQRGTISYKGDCSHVLIGYRACKGINKTCGGTRGEKGGQGWEVVKLEKGVARGHILN